jgi:hypothetical protein
MSFFQTEMQYVLKPDPDYATRFFWDAHIRQTERGPNISVEDRDIYEYPNIFEYGSPAVYNILGIYSLGGMIPVGSHFTIPIFLSLASGHGQGVPDAGTLFIDNIPLDDGYIYTLGSGMYTGSGLVYSGDIGTLAGFAGYYFYSELNFAANFVFNAIETRFTSLEINSYYSGASYDALAKKDDYGVALTLLPVPFIPWKLENKLILEFGYRHFRNVLPYFLSRYPDTGFFTLRFLWWHDSIFRGFFGNGLQQELFINYDGVNNLAIAYSIEWLKGHSLIFEWESHDDGMTLSLGWRIRIKAKRKNYY